MGHCLPGSLQSQPGFANAAGTDQGQQAVIGVVEPFGDLVQFAFSPDKARERRWQVVRRRLAGMQVPIANPLVKHCCLYLWFHPQLFRQDAATDLILSQGCAALPTQRQRNHQLAMGFLAPGLQFQLTSSIVSGLLVFPALIVAGRQMIKGLHCLAVEVLAFHHVPFLKGQAVQMESRQQIATIQIGRLSQPLHAGAAGLQATVPVFVYGSYQARESTHVQPIVAVRVEPDSLTGDVQEGWSRFPVSDGAT